MSTGRAVAVFGAYGHTGRFVVAELRARGFTPILSGRDASKLEALAAEHGGLEVRTASLEDRAALDRALLGAAAVIHCAGPFVDTAAPVIEAALRARIHYLDVTPEQAATRAAFDRQDQVTAAGVLVLPAMAFYGALADLLASAAMGDWCEADEIAIAVALDSWKPTLGTRLTGKRNVARRLVVSGGRLVPISDPAPQRAWDFGTPLGTQEVVGLGFSEIVTIAHHLRVPEVHAFMNLAPLRDVRDPATPAPSAADDSGRSSQTFLVDVVARKGSQSRRAVARGRDIYAITAPIVVEAARRVLSGEVRVRAGAVAAGEVFDAPEFLSALARRELVVELPAT